MVNLDVVKDEGFDNCGKGLPASWIVKNGVWNEN